MMAGIRLEQATGIVGIRTKEPLAIPVLGLGASGGLGETIGILLRNIATDVKTVTITDSGHWVAEEQPQQVIAAVSAFIPAPAAR